MFQRILHKKNTERGQVIILVAFAIVGLIALVGLMVDGGILFIENARLKRAIDAASVSAALQYRKNYVIDELVDSATQFLQLNQSDVFEVLIDTCDGGDPYFDPNNPPTPLPDRVDLTLCTEPRRKLVRVTASRHVNFGFLPVIGIRETTIRASSVGEAASIDMVLVVDTSSSMAYETQNFYLSDGSNPNAGNDPLDDPSVCNYSATQPCQPMRQVKDVLNVDPVDPSDLNEPPNDLIDTLFFPYDRMAIVTLTSQTAGGTRDPILFLPLTGDGAAVRSAVDNLKVFEPPDCETAYGVCLDYPSDVTGDGVNDFAGLKCPARYSTGDPSSCGSSNVGGSLTLAGSAFVDPSIQIRKDSFWVVISLVGGPANVTSKADSASAPGDAGYFGFCPDDYWSLPYCIDDHADIRHDMTSDQYDPDDYARDRADELANPVTGNGITIFTIGLGQKVVDIGTLRDPVDGDLDLAQQLLQYIALEAGDAPGATANHGSYYYAPNASQLDEIFLQIANNIFTRISQ